MTNRANMLAPSALQGAISLPNGMRNVINGTGIFMTKSSQTNQIRNGNGFIAALDQSGGSTPKALKLYGIEESDYADETEMFDRIHEMRARIASVDRRFDALDCLPKNALAGDRFIVPLLHRGFIFVMEESYELYIKRR